MVSVTHKKKRRRDASSLAKLFDNLKTYVLNFQFHSNSMEVNETRDQRLFFPFPSPIHNFLLLNNQSRYIFSNFRL